jgi:repressor LexA
MADITGLPRTQKKALEIILKTVENDRLVPTFEELAKALGLTSKVNARRVLEQLEYRDLVWMARGGKANRVISRSVKPTQKAWEWWRSQGHDVSRFMQIADEETDITVAEEPGTIFRELGQLARDASMPRTIVAEPSRLRVLEENSDDVGEVPIDVGSQNMVNVPMFERIAAGTGVIANPGSHLHQGFQFSEDTMLLPREMVGSGVLFAVRVLGDSMVNANIFDGDFVVVRQQDSADDGDIVAALIEEEATVKVLERANGHVWLMPRNPAHKPILGDYCRLMGKIVATVHRL